MNSIYTERENILPHHAEWLDRCGAVWWINRVRFGLRHDISEVSFIAFCVSDNTFLTSYDESYTHIPTGTEFCECVAEILGLPKPTFEVDISKTETTTEPIKGMAIEVSRLSESDKESLSMLQYSFQTSIKQAIKNNLCVGFWSFGSSGFSDKNFYKSAGFTITESPTEFREYVAQQTGKEYKKTAAYDVQKFVANREGMAERLAKAPFTNEELMDLPDEEIGKLNFGKPTYPHKTYRILDSLEGIPLDKRIPLSEWVPPILADVILIYENNWSKGFFGGLDGDGLSFQLLNGSCQYITDGHWMRIV